MLKLNWNIKRINETWNNGKEGDYIKCKKKDFLILEGKDNVVGEKGFITKIDEIENIGYYNFCKFVTKIYALRPVTQEKQFYDDFKLKRRNKLYNQEIIKRSLEKKKGRGQRKLAIQSGCCLKTVNNRLTKSEDIHIIKRYDNINGFRVRKTNLYFTLENIVFLFYYMQNNTTRKRLYTLKSVHTQSLINKKSIFLNGSISLNNSNDTIYNFTDKLNNL